MKEKRSQQLQKALEQRILVMDGAMGTAIQQQDLSSDDFGGEDLEGCNENLVLTRPDVITSIHQSHLEAGCDIILTNTFGATPLVLDEYALADKAHEINRVAAELARKVADKYSTKKQLRFVGGSMGPTTKAITVTGGVSFDELIEHYFIQAKGLFEGGVDYLLLETVQDTRNVKAGFAAIQRLFDDKKASIPVAVSGTIEQMGTTLAGQSAEALAASLAHHKLLYLGLNCATGPEFMTDHIRSLAKLCAFPVACVPNAGLPDEDGKYLETPQMMADVLARFIDQGWVDLIGGCCGTLPEHTAAFATVAKGRKTPKRTPSSCSFLSGIDYLEITDDLRPVIVGERTNVIGSRKFKRLICEEKFDEATEVARAQIKKGAHIIDVCLANPDREELQDMQQFLELLIKKIKAPLMIDSTDANVIEMALTYSQGKAIINSVNLEDGEERFEQVVPLANKWGAALVVGCIDDDPKQGMGVTRKRKLEIAERSYELLTKKYGVQAQDIYWDPLVFPCATGDKQYVGSAIETIEGVRLIKQRFPQTKTILGISNVSFGLPPTGREVLNSVFLYHCVKAGLDLAIVNSEKLERYASIPKQEIKLAEDLLHNRGKDPIATFADHFRGRKASNKTPKQSMSLDERLAFYIIEGSKDGLIDDLNQKLKSRKPLDIINGPLMVGMDEVGRLFNNNELIVAEVLQSAEAMKAAVAHLEPLMDKEDSAMRGKVILATVKGDVHDIGKNLVDIILSNNGFKVINLGIKVLPEKLIQAIKEYNPDIVGLSGLLVKSAQQMVSTAEDFAQAGIKTPMMVGGAALSSGFVDRKIAKAYDDGLVVYAKDAMHGLDLAKTLINEEQTQSLKTDLQEKRSKAQATALSQPKKSSVQISTRSNEINVLESLPQVNDFDRHELINKPGIDQIWKYINPLMLYGRHLGIKGSIARHLDQSANDPKLRREIEKKSAKALSIWEEVQEVKGRYRTSEHLQSAGVYQFFPVYSQANKLILGSEKQPVATFEFPRQARENGLCLADYTHPDPAAGDSIALFTVSVGKNIRELANELKDKGEYLKSHIVQVLALESAEGFAEYLHSQIRRIWGFADDPNMTMSQRFQSKYHGKRFSFGYPACPRLDDQVLLFDLIKPQKIGIELTEGFMMEPEASVSALVFHHPQATYFSVGQTGEDDNA